MTPQYYFGNLAKLVSHFFVADTKLLKCAIQNGYAVPKIPYHKVFRLMGLWTLTFFGGGRGKLKRP